MIQFIKTRNVKDPIRSVGENAGIDVYIPENSIDFRVDLRDKNNTPDDLNYSHFTMVEAGNAAVIAKVRENKTSYIDSNGKIYIAPHKDIIIPSGIRSKFGPELALIANNKSGIATKKKLVFGASVIDCSYQGEWHLHLINTSDEWQTLECGQKAIQFIPHLISTDPIEILDLTPEEFYTEKTSRGEGWQGSTGLK